MATPLTASNKDVFGVFLWNFTEMFIAPDDVISLNLCRNSPASLKVFELWRFGIWMWEEEEESRPEHNEWWKTRKSLIISADGHGWRGDLEQRLKTGSWENGSRCDYQVTRSPSHSGVLSAVSVAFGWGGVGISMGKPSGALM
jgi:hypothetical protein